MIGLASLLLPALLTAKDFSSEFAKMQKNGQYGLVLEYPATLKESSSPELNRFIDLIEKINVVNLMESDQFKVSFVSRRQINSFEEFDNNEGLQSFLDTNYRIGIEEAFSELQEKTQNPESPQDEADAPAEKLSADAECDATDCDATDCDATNCDATNCDATDCDATNCDATDCAQSADCADGGDAEHCPEKGDAEHCAEKGGAETSKAHKAAAKKTTAGVADAQEPAAKKADAQKSAAKQADAQKPTAKKCDTQKPAAKKADAQKLSAKKAEAKEDGAMKSHEKKAKDAGAPKKKSAADSDSKKAGAKKAKSAKPRSGKGVISLTAKTLNKKVLNDSEHTWLVLFYAPWCGHCKKFHPIWNTVGLKAPSYLKIAKIDGEAHKSAAQAIGLQGFPTVKIFPPGTKSLSDSVSYEGAREVDQILAAGRTHMSNRLSVLKTASIKQLQRQCSEGACLVMVSPSSRKAADAELLAVVRAKVKRMSSKIIHVQAGAIPALDSALGASSSQPALAYLSYKQNLFGKLEKDVTAENAEEFFRNAPANKATFAEIPDQLAVRTDEL